MNYQTSIKIMSSKDYNINFGCFGCAWTILEIVILVWLLMHLGYVYHLFDRLLTYQPTL